jgi:4-hydroxy-2-oxoheptanedioate aldolase
VQTFLVPYVETAEQAAAAVTATRYPPRGVRGYSGAPRAAGFGRIKDYTQHCEAELCVLVQVETLLGLKNLESIARTEGVDGVFIGPGDLSAALGHVGNQKHPEVLAAIEDAIGRIRACGQPAGILAGDDALIRRYLQLGCTFVAVGSDVGILARGSEQLAARYRA